MSLQRIPNSETAAGCHARIFFFLDGNKSCASFPNKILFVILELLPIQFAAPPCPRARRRASGGPLCCVPVCNLSCYPGIEPSAWRSTCVWFARAVCTIAAAGTCGSGKGPVSEARHQDPRLETGVLRTKQQRLSSGGLTPWPHPCEILLRAN